MNDSARSLAGRRALRAWLRWLPWGFAIGIGSTIAITLLTFPFLEARAQQSLALGAMLSACLLDWPRRREFPWWSYAMHTAVLVGGSFAVTYLMPR
ncbi:MAG: hypothetical protein ACJ8J0_26045 [Longimicrobiaceae bacterium]